MHYNILNNGIITYNTSVGNLALDYSTTAALLESGTQASISMDYPTILCVDCDFVDRIAISSVRYYFDTASIDVISSGIFFEYRDYSINPYTQLTTLYNSTDNYFFPDISSMATFAPRSIRITQDLLTHSGTGTLQTISVLNDDSVVNFGTDGAMEYSNLTCVRGEDYVITVPIFNNGTQRSIANVYMEPMLTDIDQYLYLSNSPVGPWVSIIDDSVIIVEPSVVNSGTLYDVVVSDESFMIFGEKVVNDMWASNIEEGYFITPVFRTSDIYYTNICLVNDTEDLNTKIAIDDSDYNTTVGVKSFSNLKAYNIYRKLLVVQDNVIFKDVSTVDNTTALFTSSEILYTIDSTDDLKDYYIVINPNTGWSIIFSSTDTSIYLHMINNDRIIHNFVQLLGDVEDIIIKVYKIEFDFSGGAWLYFYTSVGNEEYDISDYGHYLIHVDQNLIITFKYIYTTRSLYTFSTVYDTGNIWYTDREVGAVKLIDIVGNVLVESDSEILILPVDDLRSCCACSDGGCWYINGLDIIRINSVGELMGYFDFTGVGNNGEIGVVEVFDESSIILRQNSTIYRFITSGENIGRITFTKNLASSDNVIVASGVGIWVYCVSGYAILLEPNSGDVVYTVGEQLVAFQRVPGFLLAGLSNDIFINYFPTSTDTEWNSAGYNKITLNNYYLPNDYYNQIKVVLRVNKPFDKYDVPNTINEWNASDTFNNIFGYDLPYAHRWTYSESVSINTSSGTCVFEGDLDTLVSTERYICSQDRWYTKGLVTSNDYDIQVDYLIPETNTNDATVRIDLVPSSCLTDYIRVEVIRTGVSSMIARVHVHNYSIESLVDDVYSSNITISPIQNSGKLRIIKTGLTIYVKFFNTTTQTWQSSSCSLQVGAFTLLFGSEVSWYVKVAAISDGDVVIDSFIVNTADIYWFFDSPKVSKLFLTSAIKTDTIYPNNYKNIYIKASVPTNIGFLPENIHSYNLRVWWELL